MKIKAASLSKVTKREAILTETYVRKAHFGLFLYYYSYREPAIIGKTRYKTGKLLLKTLQKAETDTIPPSATR